jgi:hypothetical protein
VSSSCASGSTRAGGLVYRCDQPLLGREAVVKVMHQRLSRCAAQFRACVAKRIRHLDQPAGRYLPILPVVPGEVR